MDASAPLRLDRYVLYEAFAAGGMATIHFGHLTAERGFSRLVAIKRLLPHLAHDAELASMLLDEARLASRIRHPNVVSVLDVALHEGELFLVMDYVHGESLASLARTAANGGRPIPIPIAAAIVSAMLHGLHAAHEVTDDRGQPLGLVHRDVSPQNVLVGVDGTTRVVDFGVAKARDRAQTTTHGRVKGKIAYMSPEQLAGERVDRRTDVFAAGVVLWQLLTGRPLVAGDSSAATANNVLFAEVEPPSRYAVSVSPELEEITLRALSREPSERFENARQMAAAIERDVALATVTQVGEWVEETAGPVLERRSRLISELRAAERPESPDRDLRAASATQVTLAPPKRRLSSRAIALAATLPFVGAAVWAGLRPRSGAVTVVAAPGPGSSNVAAAEPSPPAQSASTAGPEPPAGASAVRPSEPPTFASRRSPPPAPHGRTGKPRAAVPPGAAPVTDAPARGGSPCKPPYTIDGDGVRHYKPDCPLE